MDAEFGGPLIDQLWRAQYGKAVEFAAVVKFARDQSGLNGFADPNVVGDEQTGDRHP